MWPDFLWGVWNGFTALVIIIVHIFGFWREFPVYNVERDGAWYQFGYWLGVIIFGSAGLRSKEEINRPSVRSSQDWH